MTTEKTSAKPWRQFRVKTLLLVTFIMACMFAIARWSPEIAVLLFVIILLPAIQDWRSYGWL